MPMEQFVDQLLRSPRHGNEVQFRIGVHQGADGVAAGIGTADLIDATAAPILKA
jgi:hypothetical protein